jgi:flagellar biosynthetic protein FlhB
MSGDSAFALLRHLTGGFALAMAPFAGGIAVAGVGAHVAQTQGAVSLKPITPDLSRLMPTAGLKRMFSSETLVHAGLALVKAVIVGAVAWSTLSHHVPDLLSLADLAPAQIALVMRDLLVRLALATGLAYAVLAGIDYGFMRFRHEQSLRMTRQEIVMEHRETEGDPQVKGRLRQIARARSRQRMLAQVPTADVVIVNPIHIAVALRYDPSAAPAPVVLALGERLLAERIKDVARKAGVPIIENIPVAHALKASATVGKMIPATLYTAIAEILAFVYRQRHGVPRAA